MRIRQLALVAQSLTPLVQNLQSVFSLGEGFTDPGIGTFGLTNCVLPVGDSFLEVVSPTQGGTTAGRLLARRGGDGGYMVIVQVDGTDLNLVQERERMAGLGVRIVFDHALPSIATIHLHPRDVGAAILSLDCAQPPASWHWAGPEWETRCRADVTHAIVGAALQSADPQATAARWGQILDSPSISQADGPPLIALSPHSVLRFLPDQDGRGDGLAEIDIATSDPNQVMANAQTLGLTADAKNQTIQLGGVCFRLVS